MHSEGILAGEMKHGPLALVDDTMPILGGWVGGWVGGGQAGARDGWVGGWVDGRAVRPGVQVVVVVGRRS